MMGNLVSVIMPVHNAAAGLAEALSSVLAQEAPPSQILVIDDGSTDATGRIARRFPVHYVRQKRLGLATARNRGVELARGGFIAFLEADDVWLPAKLRRQLEAFDRDADLDLVGGHVTADEGFGGTPCQDWGTLLVRRPAFMQVGPLITDPDVDSLGDWLARARQAELKIGMIADVVLRRRMPVEIEVRRAA